MLAVLTADCVPVVLWSAEGVIGAVHAGWRGLDVGALAATAAAMRALGAGTLHAHVGPHIGVECYQFSPDDLDRVAARLGPAVRGHTADGDPALDLHAAVGTALAAVDGMGPIDHLAAVERCTACHPHRWYSYRARAERARMATVIWRER